MSEANIFSDQNKPFLKGQVNAILRALLIARGILPLKLKFADITSLLADAEKKSEFTCGFVLLNDDKEYKAKLRQYMIKEGFLDSDNKDYISLLPKGEIIGKENPLPTAIERYFGCK